jgi:hypothetical protein
VCNTVTYSHSYSDIHSNPDAYCYCYSYFYCYSDCDGDGDGDGDANCNCNSNAYDNSHTYFNTETFTDAEICAHTQATSYSSTAPVASIRFTQTGTSRWIAHSNSNNAINFSSARTIKRLPWPRCAPTTQIVRPWESMAETQPNSNRLCSDCQR